VESGFCVLYAVQIRDPTGDLAGSKEAFCRFAGEIEARLQDEKEQQRR